MKYMISLLLLALVLPFNLSSQCPENISFNDQYQIDNFPVTYPGCTMINGNVNILGSGIQDLSGLSQIISIGGSLEIDNTDLTNMNGLSNLQHIVGDVLITSNYSLLNLGGMNNLSTIGGNLYIRFNNALTSLDGLESLTTIGGSPGSNAGFTIYENENLTDISSLQSLTYIAFGLGISSNNLSTLTGLEQLHTVGKDFYIGDNHLVNLDGLQGLTSIGGYAYINNENELISLEGLSNLTSIDGILYITDNDLLSSLTGLENILPASISDLVIQSNQHLSVCAVQSICDYLIQVGGTSNISYNSNGCNSEVQVIESCNLTQNAPTAQFSSDMPTGCVPATIVFINESSANATSYLWSFPGGVPSSSTEVNPVVTYANPGLYDVALIAYNANGSDVDFQASYVQINAFPPAAIPGNLGPYCPDQPILLVSNTIPNATYAWTGPNGFSSSEQYPQNATEPGIYTLVITSGNCVSAPATTEVLLNPLPAAGFSYSSNSENIVTFQDESEAGNSYFWDFGDGGFSILEEPVHFFTEPGQYLVTQIVTNTCGSDTSLQLIDLMVGVLDPNLLFSIEFYPNPGDGLFYLTVNGSPAPTMDIRLYDLMGHEVYAENYGFENGRLEQVLDFGGLPSATYILRIKSAGNMGYLKVVVER